MFNRLGDGLAAPSTFILDRDGVIQWRKVGRAVGDRPRVELIISAVVQHRRARAAETIALRPLIPGGGLEGDYRLYPEGVVGSGARSLTVRATCSNKNRKSL